MDGKDELCRARHELLEGADDDRSRLATAAADFLAACDAAPAWPAGVRAWAEALRAELPAKDDVAKAVAAMSDETVRRLSNELWRFSEQAEPCDEPTGADGGGAMKPQGDGRDDTLTREAERLRKMTAEKAADPTNRAKKARREQTTEPTRRP